MAKTLDNSGIEAGKNILAGNVSQSIDAFTGDEAYDVTISGSLVVTGSVIISGSDAKPIKITGLQESNLSNVVVQQASNGNINFTSSAGLNVGNVQLNRLETTPSGVVGQLIASGSATACKLYFHNGTEFKEIQFVS
tara:strand:+ start:6347 stop:6757 length:411 start_codon:yes stop_codon:yes gene_type:complete